MSFRDAERDAFACPQGEKALSRRLEP